MNALMRSVEAVGLDQVLAPENLEYFYPAELVQPNMTEEESLPLRMHLQFYPVVKSRLPNFANGTPHTYIPILDHEARACQTYMGVMIARSKIINGMFALTHLPYPSNTPLPTRINSTLNGLVEYDPIQGFLIKERGIPLHKFDIALLVGKTPEQVRMQKIAKAQHQQYVAHNLFRFVRRSLANVGDLPVQN